MKTITTKKFIFRTLIWVVILAGLVAAKFLYDYLVTNNRTRTEDLSLFDVIQITGVIVVLFMANRSRIKLDIMERRMNDLHQELSIKLSEENSN